MIGVGAPTSYAGQDIELKIKGTSTSNAPITCEMKNVSQCVTLNAEEVIMRLALSMNIPSK
jgi:hypothetical protein